MRAQRLLIHPDLSRVAAAVRQAQDGENDQRDGDRRHRGDQHVADMREERRAADGGGHHRRVAQRRDLVAEIGPGDDGAGDEAFAESFRLADAQQGDADRRDRGPRTANHHGDQRADDAGGQ